jgi:hypothetical protein
MAKIHEGVRVGRLDYLDAMGRRLSVGGLTFTIGQSVACGRGRSSTCGTRHPGTAGWRGRFDQTDAPGPAARFARPVLVT